MSSPPPLLLRSPARNPVTAEGGWDRLQSRDLSSDEGGLTIFGLNTLGGWVEPGQIDADFPFANEKNLMGHG